MRFIVPVTLIVSGTALMFTLVLGRKADDTDAQFGKMMAGMVAAMMIFGGAALSQA